MKVFATAAGPHANRARHHIRPSDYTIIIESDGDRCISTKNLCSINGVVSNAIELHGRSNKCVVESGAPECFSVTAPETKCGNPTLHRQMFTLVRRLALDISVDLR